VVRARRVARGHEQQRIWMLEWQQQRFMTMVRPLKSADGRLTHLPDKSIRNGPGLLRYQMKTLRFVWQRARGERVDGWRRFDVPGDAHSENDIA